MGEPLAIVPSGHNEPAAPLSGALGDLIDALGDDLQHEVFHAMEVREAVVAAIEAMGDDRYRSYLDSWWLGGAETEGWSDDA